MSKRGAIGPQGSHWEPWPGSIYPYFEVWDDVDTRDVPWRRDADGNIEVFV